MKNGRLFDRQSELYSRARPGYPDSLYRFIESRCSGTGLAWDCATGNGQSAIGIAGFFDRVVATDISEVQLANAFNADNIEYRVSPAEASDFPEACFDLVNVSQALHWFNLEQFWPEVHRVLKSGGLFVASSYSGLRFNDPVDDALRNHLGIVVGSYWAENLKLCWSRYSTIEFPFDSVESRELRIEGSWSLDDLLGYLRTWSATEACIAENGEEFFLEASEKIAAVWGSPDSRKNYHIPLTAIAGRNPH